MATLKKIQRNPQLSVFQQEAPGAGMAAIWSGLADGMSAVADYLTPGAIEEMEQRGADAVYGDGGGVPVPGGPAPETAYPSSYGGTPGAAYAGGYYTPEDIAASYGAPAPEADQTAAIQKKWTLNDPGATPATPATPEEQAVRDKMSRNDPGAGADALPGPGAAANPEAPTTPTAPAPQVGWKSNISFEPTSTTARQQRPRPETAQIFDLAVFDTFGPSATGVITGGMDTPGSQGGASRRHPWGYAIDGKVRFEDGSYLGINDPKFPAFMQALRKYGATSAGAGEGYMGAEAFHFDTLPREMYGAGQGSSWGGHGAPAAAMAMDAESPIGFFTTAGSGYKPGEGWGEDGMPVQWAAAYGGENLRVTPTGGIAAMAPANYVGGGSLSNSPYRGGGGNFADLLPRVLRHEGGYSNHPEDNGGATMNGVTQARYNEYRRDQGLSTQDVRNLSEDERSEIYRKYYFDEVRGDELPPGVDYAIFDFAVNSGPSRAIKFVQEILGLPDTGKMTDAVVSAIQKANPVELATALNDKRLGWLQGLGDWQYFGNGWSNRLRDVRADSIAIASGNASVSGSAGNDRLSTKGQPADGPIQAGSVTATQLGMAGGLQNGSPVQSGKAGTGQAHGTDYGDYSMAFRVVSFDKMPGGIQVGEREGKPVYAAPDYLRDENGDYITHVSADKALQLAEETGSLFMTAGEYASLREQTKGVDFTYQSGPDGGPATNQPGNGDGKKSSDDFKAKMAGYDPQQGVHGFKEMFISDESGGTGSAPAARAASYSGASSGGTPAPGTTIPASAVGAGGPPSGGAPSGGGMPPSGGGGVPALTGPTTMGGRMMMTASGVNRPPLYSVYSGPILRAYNEAAKVAYLSEVSNRAAVDLQSLRAQYEGDPQGFAQAANSYISSLVADAPAPFRRGLRQSLSATATRATTGIMAAQQADIRQRANNSSAAMVDRLSDQYAEALAAGDGETAMAIGSELDAALRMRETLPGVAWTREQSDNVFIKAQQQADRISQQTYNDQVRDAKGIMDTIIKAAKVGMTAADEVALADPFFQQADPERWREASAFVKLRDMMPEFFKLPPDVATAMAEQLQDVPVQDGWEADLASAAAKAAKANKAAWEEDPIQRAFEVMESKPTEMPDYVPGNEKAFVDWLQSRADYGNTLADNGYIDTPAFLTKEETSTLSGLLGKDADPALRATVAGMVVAGMGEQAGLLFDTLKIDNVTRMSGKYMAKSGNAAVVAKAFQGQALIDEGGLIQLPSITDQRDVIGSLVPMVGESSPDTAIPKEILDFAEAIYAADAAGIDPSSPTGKSLFESALQTALGQMQNPRGKTTGGIQDVAGYKTFVPLDVSGEDIDAALGVAFGVPDLLDDQAYAPAWNNMGAPADGAPPDARRFGDLDPEIWSKLAVIPPQFDTGMPMPAMVPMLGREPLDPNLFRSGFIKLRPTAQGDYEMVYTGGETEQIVMSPLNIPFIINLEALLDLPR